ncbi:alkaline-phosphatase-like protein [Limtongia smithiae]|uniref:alkaline-phosphatase-like protein n=1 Tax=Limtongia smithiae TaxID=1125753 RepID=UPI0034CE157C
MAEHGAFEKRRDSFTSQDLEEEDITGSYDPRSLESDREILLRHDAQEMMIANVLNRKSALKKRIQEATSPREDKRAQYKQLLPGTPRNDGESDSETEIDAEALLKHLKKKQRRIACVKTCFFFVLCALVVSIVGFAGYVAFIKRKFGLTNLNPWGTSTTNSTESSTETGFSTTIPTVKTVLSNGTHEFHPTTIYISLDGFRPDYLTPEYTPSMWEMYTTEYSAPYMFPSFPSVTFPNHYTMVTGLYPSSHGIVGNRFWDPELQEEFNYHSADAMDSKWWKGEPIWVTASKNDIKTGIHMWPGSEAPWGDYEPEYVDKFNKSETLQRKAQRVLGWLDMDVDTRPELILAYVPTIDTLGHRYGTLGPEIDGGLQYIDDMIANILDGIHSRNLSSIVNVIIVSDHGMASTSNDRIIFMDDFISPAAVEHIDGWPLFGLRPYEYNTTLQIFAEVQQSRVITQIEGGEEADDLDHWSLYTRDNMPEEWHFGGTSGGQYQYRIADVWMIPEAGWSITTHSTFAKQNYDYHPKGVHGYNNTHPLMRALFLATGPSFPSGLQVEPFYNTELYEVVCGTLNITAAPNNGTLHGRLDLLPEGWMDPVQFPMYEPDYVPSSAVPSATATFFPSLTVAEILSSATGTATDMPDDDELAYFRQKLDNLTDSINDILDNMDADTISK